MAKNIKRLFRQEKRNPVSINVWLKSQGYDDEAIRISMAEHAQMIADGTKFGYVNGISVLSNAIRDRVIELTKQKEAYLINSFGVFKPTDPLLKRAWTRLKKPVFKVKNGS